MEKEISLFVVLTAISTMKAILLKIKEEGLERTIERMEAATKDMSSISSIQAEACFQTCELVVRLRGDIQ